MSIPSARALDADRYVSSRLRRRRITLGLTQQQMAEIIGITHQQAHKYEAGINRISAGRLYQIAKVLNVEVGYFYKNIDPDNTAQTNNQELTPQRRMLLDLVHSFTMMTNRKHQEAVCFLVRALSCKD